MMAGSFTMNNLSTNYKLNIFVKYRLSKFKVKFMK